MCQKTTPALASTFTGRWVLHLVHDLLCIFATPGVYAAEQKHLLYGSAWARACKRDRGIEGRTESEGRLPEAGGGNICLSYLRHTAVGAYHPSAVLAAPGV
jgi:hypothetical protein